MPTAATSSRPSGQPRMPRAACFSFVLARCPNATDPVSQASPAYHRASAAYPARFTSPLAPSPACSRSPTAWASRQTRMRGETEHEQHEQPLAERLPATSWSASASGR